MSWTKRRLISAVVMQTTQMLPEKYCATKQVNTEVVQTHKSPVGLFSKLLLACFFSLKLYSLEKCLQLFLI